LTYSISREIVIKQWLNGRQCDTIALETGLSTGTVSSFINTWKEEVGNLAADELRELGVALRKTGTTPLQCAKGFRILNLLHELGFTEEDAEQFVRSTYKMCRNIGLQPDKIALHINELIGLTEKVPLDEISNHIHKNISLREESEQELERVTTQLKDARAQVDNAFSKYNIDSSQYRWAYWLKKELAERGLEFKSITDLVNTIEDFYALGFDAKKIVSKILEIQDLETKANSLKSEISRLQELEENESRQLKMLKQFSSTHIQASYVYGQLEYMGFGLRQLTLLHNTITELAKGNGFSESMAVNKLMDDVTKNYNLVCGFESRLEELKSETEDAEVGLTMLHQSEAEMDNVTSSIRKLWAMGITSDDIINLVKSLDKETINNNIGQENKTINNDNLQSNLREHHNLRTAIVNLNKDKNELVLEILTLMSTREWLATSTIHLTSRVVHYFEFLSRIMKCMRIHVQIQVLYSYMTYHELHITYSNTQELSKDKLSITSDSNQEFLPIIKSTCDNNTKINKLKQVFIDTIRNVLHILKSNKSQNKDDDNSMTANIAASNHKKLVLEHTNDSSL
jgi:hypothetical protein